MKKHLSVLVLLMAVTTILFAGGGAEKQAVSKPILTVWDQFYPASQNELMDDFVSEFEKLHDVKVERVLYDTESLRTTLRTALASGHGPDIFYYDAGPAYLGAFANAGLVADLTPMYESKGWNEEFAGWAVERVMYNGKKWGIPHEIEFTCLYYNKDIVRELGFSEKIVRVPGTKDVWTFSSFQDYLDLVEASKNAGYIGMSLGMRNPGYGGHLFSYLVTLTAGKKGVDEILFGNGSWDSPAIVEALEYFKAFSDKGYYTPSPNSVSYDETNALFFGGRIATNPSGTWLISDLLDQVDNSEQFGMLLLPMIHDPAVISAGSGLGSAFAVSAGSKNIDLAVEFLDYVTNKTNSERWINQGQVIPANKLIDIEKIELPEMMEQAIEGAGLEHAYNLDVVMPAEWNSAMMNGIQALINGTDTPVGVATKMQKAWTDAKSAGDIWKAF